MKHWCCRDVREELVHKLAIEEFVVDKTGCKMLEIVGATFVADEPAIFGTVNWDYVQREIDWYISQSLSVNDFPGGAPEVWKAVAGEDGLITSNYGWVNWHRDNYFQYNHALEELKKNPYSRRAVVIHTRPRIWLEYNDRGRGDFMCTNAVQYLIRDGKLHVLVQMRSNDVVFGYKNDRAWAEYMQRYMIRDLNTCQDAVVEAGDIYWHASSLHVYEKHFHLVKE